MSTSEQTTGRTRKRRTVPTPNGIAVGVGFAGAIVATTLAVATGSTHDVWWALVPLGLVTAVVSGTTGWFGGIATAWICWSLDSGFVLGREAQLLIETGLVGTVLFDVAIYSTSLLVEGGAQIAGALLRAGLVDRVAWFHAPSVMGGDGWPAAAAFGAATLAVMPRFAREESRALGPDMLTTYRRS